MNLKSLLMEAESRLREAGVPDSNVDARELLFFAFDIDQKTYLLNSADEADAGRMPLFRDCIERRCRRIPLQHITGRVGFMGMEFSVSPDVLCPRQDTEILVECAAAFAREGMKVLDLCTGSGCVLISLLQMKRGLFGLGVDISDRALAVARENAKRLESRARFVQGDLFESVSGKFDMITCNPPYIKSGDIPGLMPEVRDHEPVGALDGGEDGLSFYRRVSAEAADYLAAGGRLFFEIGVSQREAVSSILLENGYKDIKCYKDYASNDRVLTAGRT